MPDLPSTRSLMALEAVDRLGSVRSAAEELCLTRSAVSHQLRGLSWALGFDLLVPSGRGVVLSAQALHYVEAIRPLLRRLDAAQGEARGIETPRMLRIASTPGFTHAWLGPNIADYRAIRPDLSMTITTSSTVDTVLDIEADVWVTYGSQDAPGLDCRKLGHFDVFPVAAPGIARRGMASEADLVDLPRLMLRHQEGDWDRWLRATGRRDTPRAAMVFSDITLMLSAAQRGEGVCMGDDLTAGPRIADGRLVRLSERTVPSERPYCVVMRSDRPTPMEGAFARWIRARWDATRDVTA